MYAPSAPAFSDKFTQWTRVTSRTDRLLSFVIVLAVVCMLSTATIFLQSRHTSAQGASWFHAPSVLSPSFQEPIKGANNDSTPGATGLATRSAQLPKLPFWDVSDPSNKIIGVSLGNWLVLERWMNEDWFVSHAPNAEDEWTFVKSLGPVKAARVLDQHWSTWIVEPDLDEMQRYAINHVRIPLPFWTLVPTKRDEPYINTTQLVHLDKLLGWLHKRRMRALIDLHAMPGGQNGDQACGHAGQYDWFKRSNQRRSVDTIRNLIDWLAQGKHKSVVTGVAPVNEPCGTKRPKKAHWAITRSFYEKVYPILKDAGYPMYFHHAFAPNPVEFWREFATGKDPRFLVFTDNPYPGDFPPQSNEAHIISTVCSNMLQYSTFTVPSVKTEWSLASGIQSRQWDAEYFSTQASAYGWSAGSFFWSWRLGNSSLTLAEGRAANANNLSLMKFSLSWLLKQPGIIPRQKSPNQSAKAYLQALTNTRCGPMRDLTYASLGASLGGFTEGANQSTHAHFWAHSSHQHRERVSF